MQFLQINPEARWRTETIGNGNHRLILADDFYMYADQVRGLAQSLYYCSGPEHGNFPGARAVVSLDLDDVIASLSQAWGTALQPVGGTYKPVVFSVIKNEEGRQLNEAQRQPHIDPGVSAMVYLNPDSECAGGTGIYRHKPTGLERIPPTPTPEILAIAAEHGFTAGDLATPQGYRAFQNKVVFHPSCAATGNEYINDGNDSWELLHQIEMKYNRLVIFDGRMPHSQHLAQGQFQNTVRLNQIVYLVECPR